MKRFDEVAREDALVATSLTHWQLFGSDKPYEQMLEELVVLLVEQRDKYHDQLVDLLRTAPGTMPATFGQINTIDMRGGDKC